MTGLRDPLAAAALALLLYLLLGQDSFYKIDGHLYLAYVLNGERSYPRHFLYLPLVFAARDVLAPLGMTLYESARALSAVGAALGVGFLCAASRALGLPRRDAWLVTALAATVPSVVFFATVVEVHGPFLAFSGLAAWCAARLAAAPGVGRGVVLGIVCALAFCAHSTAALLPALLLPLVLTCPPRPLRAALPACAATAVALAAGIAATPWLATLVHVDFDLRHSGEFATDRAGRNLGELWRYGSTLLHEWLLPMLPLSLLVPAWLLVPRLRQQVAWLLAAAALYLFASIMILGGEPEWGAYLLPFAWPLGLLAVQALPRAVVAGVVAVQLALAITAVALHDDARPTNAYAAGVHALAGGAPVALLVGDDIDLQTLLLHLPAAERVPLFELARLPAAALPEAARALQEKIDALLDAGVAVLVSDAARARVQAIPAVTPCGPGLVAMLAERYREVRSAHPGFAGSRLVR